MVLDPVVVLYPDWEADLGLDVAVDFVVLVLPVSELEESCAKVFDVEVGGEKFYLNVG